MYKNQLQELAQRSCFNLPSYSCIREGPDHAPRFKAAVNFNGETFESPTFCSTLRQAEHAAAEVALDVLSKKGPSKVLAARVLDETGVYKNLLQETSHRAGLKLPVYTTVRSGPGHGPVFSCTVELAGMSFTGEPAKTKKQAQKNAALAAWSALKKQAKSAFSSSSFSPPSSESGTNDEQDQAIIARYLATLKGPETNNSQREHQTIGVSAPIRREVIPYGDARSLNSLQHQNWHCIPFYPELSLYQTCPQERVFRQQNLLALSSLPSSSPRPQIFPFIRSMFQPDHGYYFPSLVEEPVSLVPEIGPFLYFSNRVMPVPVRNVSQVSIQEIEENPRMEEDWRKGDGGSDCWQNNCPSNVSRLSQSEIPNSLVSFNSQSEQRMQEGLQEKGEERSVSSASSAPNAEISNQLQRNQTEQYNWFSPGFIDARFRPTTISKDGDKFRLQNTVSLDYLQSDIRPRNLTVVSSSGSVRGSVPPSFAAPTTIRASATAPTASLRPESSNPLMRAPPPWRTAASVCSSRPWPEGMRNQGGIPSRHYMAPAVHIRSVVPVCSAPPSKNYPDPSREKRTEEQRGDISATCSNFSKLQL